MNMWEDKDKELGEEKRHGRKLWRSRSEQNKHKRKKKGKKSRREMKLLCVDGDEVGE